MCLGKAFVENNNNELNPIMENVSQIAMENGLLVLTSLFGEQCSVSGEVKHIDFGNSKIIIKEAN
ncbi:putative RNA-binding protein [Alkalibaculum bacchi]|uniref:Putative RNA-binding protein n=1 Tax=Alkalibaculum bacchi TaxID=645887 RepID=A0A366IEF1_9FIRM|nr:CooT family nickel-binding protein [Alkalibaculum bacchi]RBP68249.1 putative RNA-binding protein [Alkalibaculum bacchi]